MDRYLTIDEVKKYYVDMKDLLPPSAAVLNGTESLDEAITRIEMMLSSNQLNNKLLKINPSKEVILENLALKIKQQSQATADAASAVAQNKASNENSSAMVERLKKIVSDAKSSDDAAQLQEKIAELESQIQNLNIEASSADESNKSKFDGMSPEQLSHVLQEAIKDNKTDIISKLEAMGVHPASDEAAKKEDDQQQEQAAAEPAQDETKEENAEGGEAAKKEDEQQQEQVAAEPKQDQGNKQQAAAEPAQENAKAKDTNQDEAAKKDDAQQPEQGQQAAAPAEQQQTQPESTPEQPAQPEQNKAPENAGGDSNIQVISNDPSLTVTSHCDEHGLSVHIQGAHAATGE